MATLRRAATAGRRRQRPIAVLPVVSMEAASEMVDEVAAKISTRHPMDLVLRVDVASFIANRRSLCRGILGALLEGEGAAGWIELLRGSAPGGQSAASWFENMTDMSRSASQRLGAALSGSDHEAIIALLARANPGPDHLQGEFYVRPPAPLGESDARALLFLLLAGSSHEVVWFLMEGLDELLYETSPLVSAFGRGLDSFIDVVMDLERAALVAPVFSGLMRRLSRHSSRLAPACPDVDIDLETPKDLDPEFMAASLARARGVGEPVPYAQHNSWVSIGTQSVPSMLFVWPVDSRDPSARLADVVGVMAPSFEDRPFDVVAPRWAFGDDHLPSREALAGAFSGLNWLPQSSVDLCLLWKGGSGQRAEADDDEAP